MNKSEYLESITKDFQKLTDDEKAEWDRKVESLARAFGELCDFCEKHNISEIPYYPFHESMDEYPFKVNCMKLNEVEYIVMNRDGYT